MFAGRDHVHTAVYRFAWQSGPVDAIVALDRGFAGAIVAAVEPGTPRLALPTAEVPVEVGLRLERTIISQVDPPAHDLVLAFCATDPVATFTAHAARFAAHGFAGPFLATVPGTDTYDFRFQFTVPAGGSVTAISLPPTAPSTPSLRRSRPAR